MTNLNESLEVFRQIAENPRKQLDAILAGGAKVVGCLPEYVPEELVVAANMVPFGVWGGERPIAEARKYFPPFYCSIAQASLEMGLRGELDGLSAVLIPVLCDTLKCLGQNWKIGVPQVPFIQVSYPQNTRLAAANVYLAKVYQEIAAKLAAISGVAVTPAALRHAIGLYNRHRAVMRAFSAAVADNPGALTPYQRNTVIKSAYFLPKVEHAALVEPLTAALKASAPAAVWTGKKVVVTGILADSKALLDILATNQIAVVADQVAHESLQFDLDAPPDDDPYAALAKRFTSIAGCSLVADPEKRRGARLIELARATGATGVVYLLSKFCDPEEFDYPIVKRELDEAGLACINIEVDQQASNFEQARTALETFVEIL